MSITNTFSSLSARLPAWQDVVSRGRGVISWARLPGFRFAETMVGSAEIQGQKRDMRFDIEARATDLWSHLRDGHTAVSGTITIAGLCTVAPLSGDLWVQPLTQRRIRYRFRFKDSADQTYLFVGEKQLKLRHFRATLTTLPGEIAHEEGQPTIGTATLHFPMDTLAIFLKSFRPLPQA